MAIATRDMSIFYDLKQDELDMVPNYAASLIRNRVQHIEDYYKFQKIRDRMLAKKNDVIPIGTKIWKMCLLISRKIGIFPYKKEPMDIISTDSI